MAEKAGARAKKCNIVKYKVFRVTSKFIFVILFWFQFNHCLIKEGGEIERLYLCLLYFLSIISSSSTPSATVIKIESKLYQNRFYPPWPSYTWYLLMLYFMTFSTVNSSQCCNFQVSITFMSWETPENPRGYVCIILSTVWASYYS